MIIQKVLKGISGIDRNTASEILNNGIISNWWRVAGNITPAQIKQNLTEANLNLHLNRYHSPVPAANPLSAYTSSKFGDITPFISTTAGVVERVDKKRNLIFSPLITSIRFATNNFKSSGYVFYCYVFTIGKKAVEFQLFSEEIRELNIYTDYQPYYRQGEVMAKILIPSVQIQKAEYYIGKDVIAQTSLILPITPDHVLINGSYVVPEIISNIREVL